MQHDKNACFTKIKIFSIINFAARFVATFFSYVKLFGCFFLESVGVEWIQINELIWLIKCDEMQWVFC